MSDLHVSTLASRAAGAFVFAALAAELVDELVDGVSSAAWPLLQPDLALSYPQVGLLLGLPAVLANLIEPAFGILADAGQRRFLVLGGGVCFAAALAFTALSGGFWSLLAASLLFYPASGAFISLTQGSLMDAEPQRREQNMARWALAGSVGNVVGPLLLSFSLALGLGWRPVFAVLAILAVVALIALCRSGAVLASGRATEAASFKANLFGGLRDLLAQLRRPEVRRSLLLLEFANLMMDVFRSFVALYFVDAVHVGAAQGALAVAVLTVVGLIGDALVVPLLERVPGVAYVRLSALGMALVFPLFLLVPGLALKLPLLGLLGLLSSGWYAVLQARLYSLIPERSGAVMALSSVAGMLGAAVPVLLGVLAERFGVGVAIWTLLLGPLALLLGLPARVTGRKTG